MLINNLYKFKTIFKKNKNELQKRYDRLILNRKNMVIFKRNTGGIVFVFGKESCEKTTIHEIFGVIYCPHAQFFFFFR